MSCLFHLIKHPIATAITVAGTCVAWTVTYVLLLAWAVVIDQPLGGVLAYPAWLLFLSLAAGFASFMMFMPSTIIGSLAAQNLQLKPWWELLISVLMLPVFAFFALWIVELVIPEYAVSSSMRNAAILAAICVVPLFAYWLLLKGMDWLLDFLPKKPATVGSCGCLSFTSLIGIAYLIGFLVIFDISDAAIRRDANSYSEAIGPRPRSCCEPLDDPIHYSGDEWCFLVFNPLVRFYNFVYGYNSVVQPY